MFTLLSFKREISLLPAVNISLEIGTVHQPSVNFQLVLISNQRSN